MGFAHRLRTALFAMNHFVLSRHTALQNSLKSVTGASVAMTHCESTTKELCGKARLRSSTSAVWCIDRSQKTLSCKRDRVC